MPRTPRATLPAAILGNRAHKTRRPHACDRSRSELDDRHIRTLSELAREDAALGDNYAPLGYYQNIAIRGYPLDLGSLLHQRLRPYWRQSASHWKTSNKSKFSGPGGDQCWRGGTRRRGELHQQAPGSGTRGDAEHRMRESSRYAALDAGGWLSRPRLACGPMWCGMPRMHVEHADGRRGLVALAADWKFSGYHDIGAGCQHPYASFRCMLLSSGTGFLL